MSECECGASLNSQDDSLCQKCLAENDIDSDGWDAVFETMELLEAENLRVKGEVEILLNNIQLLREENEKLKQENKTKDLSIKYWMELFDEQDKGPEG